MGIINVQNLGKKYILSHKTNKASYSTIRETLASSIKNLGARIFNKNTSGAREEFWALKDVCFEIEQGDRIGIIGRNGAGKTTLLKLLSRITEPSTGRIELNGRVASLLEVGTGFHPELTGRENIFLNGAILGMKRKEIKRKFDEIVAFAEVEKFLDTPVKRYSSGMYVRLAFAVAAHLEPEILIVDEVLAVGDAAFQKKCLGKMEDVSTQEGRTVLFVSHNMGMVRQLCSKGFLFNQGSLTYSGTIEKTIENYMKDISDRRHTDGLSEKDVPQGTGKFIRWEILNSRTESKHSCYSREKVSICFTFVSRRIIKDARIGFHIFNSAGQNISVSTSLDNGGTPFELDNGTYKFVFTLRLPVKGDTYFFQIRMRSGKEDIDVWDCVPGLIVISSAQTHLQEHVLGILNEDILFEMKKV